MYINVIRLTEGEMAPVGWTKRIQISRSSGHWPQRGVRPMISTLKMSLGGSKHPGIRLMGVYLAANDL
jgi:hypothetical protein